MCTFTRDYHRFDLRSKRGFSHQWMDGIVLSTRALIFGPFSRRPKNPSPPPYPPPIPNTNGNISHCNYLEKVLHKVLCGTQKTIYKYRSLFHTLAGLARAQRIFFPYNQSLIVLPVVIVHYGCHSRVFSSCALLSMKILYKILY